MVDSAAASNPPPSLEARPPTPPRDSCDSDAKPARFGFAKHLYNHPTHRRASAPVAGSVAVESPVHTPGSGSKSGKKKVLWSELTEYEEAPAPSFDGKNIRRVVQPLAPSSERKPPKSILKASNGLHEQERNGVGASPKLRPLHHHPTFAIMLDSILQQLAGNDRSSKMDAYLMLSSTLKASDNVPDLKALKAKMGLLCHFIGQDLLHKLENGKPDTTLVVNALVLLSSFLQKPAISEMFSAEFSVQMVEHAIKTFEGKEPSKEIIKHLMFIMAQQSFPAKVMTEKRVGKLVMVLHNMDLSGKSIAMSRINICRALLRQSRSHMVSNPIWFNDMFTDMLSSLKEIRTQAITFAFEAASALSTDSNATRAVTNLFALQPPEKEFYAKFYANQLKGMVRKKDDWDSASVPQIWSIIMLFFRSRPQALEQWQFFNDFLQVIQLCFNSGNIPTRAEANIAWNRFIFAVQLSEKTSPKFRGLLSQAIFTQIGSRKSHSNRKRGLGSMNFLLYYALRPQSTPNQLELYWDEYVAPLAEACLNSAKEREGPEVAKQEATDACIILQCLFDSTTQRKWSESRAIESLQQLPMDPTELPALDSRWLRKNHARVFKVLVPLIERLYWDLGDDTPITRLWKTYITSISSPAVAEIDPHLDTMSCVASIFSMLHKFWNVGGDKLGSLPPANAFSTAEKSAAFLKGFGCIILTTLTGLRVLPFSKRSISIAHNSFFAVPTPTHQQPRKIRNESRPPLHHLLLLLTSPSPGLDFKEPFAHMVHLILQKFWDSQQSKKAKMELLNNLFHLLPSDKPGSSRVIWEVLAGFAATTTSLKGDQESGSDEPLPSLTYKTLIEFLSKGVNLSPNSVPRGWEALFDALITSATLDVGDAGRAIAVIEPLAKIFTTSVPNVDIESRGLCYLNFILEKATYPKDRRALDAAAKRLTGGPATQKPSTFDPYVHLYEYVRTGLETAYDTHSPDHLDANAKIIAATTALLSKCPISLIFSALAKLQLGIIHWVIDSEAKLVGGDTLSRAVATLWAMVKKLIKRLLENNSHSRILNELELSICAGFESKHKSVFVGTVSFWNSSFGSCEEHLEYPEHSKEVLLRVRQIAEIQLPSFPDILEEEPSANQRQPVDFLDPQDSSDLPAEEQSPMTRKLRSATPRVLIQVNRSTSAKRSRETTPPFGKRKSRKLDVTPRFRHDDSQVQFEAIESSPLADRIMDSQLLTDRQKETKERQNTDQAMFPDLRSTPVAKEKLVQNDSEVDLPIHRSSSQLRTRNVTITRATTPTLVLPSDDDGFIASSPTPTRAIQGEKMILDPPSSPPEVLAKEARLYKDSYLEVTPSPGPIQEPSESASEDDETSMDLDHTTEFVEKRLELSELEPSSIESHEVANETFSMGPSAQINPFIFTNSTISSVELTPQGRHSSSVEEDPSRLFRISQREEDTTSAMEVDGEEPLTIEGHPDLANKGLSTIGSLNDPQHPGTPIQPTFNSPVGDFVDAPSSPASSDKQVFEDAVSSPPRMTRQKAAQARISSTTSDFGNDSSFVRMMAEYDEPAPARLPRNATRNTLRRSPRVSLSKSEIPPTPEIPVSARRSPLKQTTNVQDVDQAVHSTSDPTRSSSILSLVPETPGFKAKVPIIGNDGVEYDEEDTIVVDTSSLHRFQPTATRSKRSRKRKHQDVSGDSNEVPDSQNPAAGRDNTSPKKSSPKKKKRPRGRPRRESRIKQAESQSQDADLSQEFGSQDVSVDLDAPVTDVAFCSTMSSFTSSVQEDEMEEIDRTASPARTNFKVEQTSEKSVEEEPTREQQYHRQIASTLSSSGDQESGEILPTPSNGIEIRAATENSFVEETLAAPSVEAEPPFAIGQGANMGTSDANQTNETTVDIIEETRIEEFTLSRKSSSPVVEETHIEESVLSESWSAAADKPAVIVGKELDIPEAIMTKPSAAAPLVSNTPATVDSMADRLQSLLDDLQTASLSREEANRLEDLFMDAKGHLYGAARRGRLSAEKEW